MRTLRRLVGQLASFTVAGPATEKVKISKDAAKTHGRTWGGGPPAAAVGAGWSSLKDNLDRSSRPGTDAANRRVARRGVGRTSAEKCTATLGQRRYAGPRRVAPCTTDTQAVARSGSRGGFQVGLGTSALQ